MAKTSLIFGGRDEMMMLAIGSDHGGFALKQKISEHLQQCGVEFYDFGVHSSESADYPDVAFAVAEAVASEPLREESPSGSMGTAVTSAATASTMGATAKSVPASREAFN